MSAKPLRQPLKRPPDLFALMSLCGVEDFTGSLGAVYRCPVCGGRRPESRPGDDPPPIETLRIHVNAHNEVVVRCHACGLAGSALELVRKHTGLPWAEIGELMEQSRVFGDDPVPDGWIERAKDWERFAMKFDQSKAWLRMFVRGGQVKDLHFGEVGLYSGIQVRQTLPGLKITSRWNDKDLFYIELYRSLLGLPTHVRISRRRKGCPIAAFSFQPPEPVVVAMPEWVLFRDWSDELILFTDLGMSGELLDLVAKLPSGVAPPLAWVANCRGPVMDEIPCRTVQYLRSGKEGPELGLAFAQPGVNALVQGKEAIECVADHIIERTMDADPISYLHAVLQKPWISPSAAERLTLAVSERLEEGAADRIARSGATDRVLPCTIRGTTYLCRNGIYVKKSGKKDWQPCSNFSLRIEESILCGKELVHRLLLLMEAGMKGFTVTEDELQDGRILLRKAVAAANNGAIPDLPQLVDAADLKYLPRIVRTTQLKPPVRVAPPAVLGFEGGRFHGPNYRVTAHGVGFFTATRHQPLSSMLPEQPWGVRHHHLACRANELAIWLAKLEPPSRRMASVVLYAAIAWLHRGSRGLSSHLLLPSETHLDLLGRFIGVVPIEVGRGAGEHPGAPRLMRSSYWRPDQFEKHGCIVAALEDRHRRTNRQIPIVVQQSPRGEAPSPPASILSLLAHCVLGSSDTAAACTRLAGLVECPNAQRRFAGDFKQAEAYLVKPGRYLDAFLGAVHELPDLQNYVIRRSQKTYLIREAVIRLNEDFYFGFKETRLIDELRQRYPIPQPARYGREQIPAFRLPPEAIARA